MALKSKKSEVVEEKEVFDDGDATVERLMTATHLVSKQFGLDSSYHCTKFNDKGRVIELTLDGEDFVVAVTIKNSEAHGMI